MHDVLLTIDVEDWFQVENLKTCIPFSSSWASCELRVERSTHRLLDLLDSVTLKPHRTSHSTGATTPKATFFVLGWIAERLPNLVREIHARGHEVASHGYYHKLCTECSREELKRDLTDSKQLLEDIIGHAVYGYRAPSFSIHKEAFEVLKECGYTYDSSLNSFALNSRYGKVDISRNPRLRIAREISDGFYELPISQFEFGGRSFPLGGGGFFRLLPLPILLMGVRSILKKQEAYLFYLHPWEIDPGQPRVDGVPAVLRFRHYVNLNSTFAKLTSLIERFRECRFATIHQYLQGALLGSRPPAMGPSPRLS